MRRIAGFVILMALVAFWGTVMTYNSQVDEDPWGYMGIVGYTLTLIALTTTLVSIMAVGWFWCFHNERPEWWYYPLTLVGAPLTVAAAIVYQQSVAGSLTAWEQIVRFLLAATYLLVALDGAAWIISKVNLKRRTAKD